MDQQTDETSFQLNITLFLAAILSLLSLTNILFLFGWYEPVVALIASMGIVLMQAYLMRKLGAECQQYKLYLTRKDILKLAAALLIIFVFLFCYGFAGFFPNIYDHVFLRNALYSNLRDAAWPIVLPNGKELTYYVAGILPPAIVARLFSADWSGWILLFYVTFLCSVIYMLICFFLKRVSLLPLLFILFLSDPITEVSYRIIAYTGMDIPFFHTWVSQQNLFYFSPIGMSIGTYNSAFYAFIVLALILIFKTHRLISLPFLVVLLVPIAPLSAIAIMPIVLYYYLPSFKDKSQFLYGGIALILPIGLAVLYAVYFLAADNNTVVMRFAWVILGDHIFISFYIRQIVATIIALLPLILCKAETGLKYLLIVPLLLAIIYIGFIPDGLHGVLNELYLKGIVLYSFLAVVLWVKYWDRIGKIRYYFILCILIGVTLFVKDRVTQFDPNTGRRDLWNGHLGHDHPYLNISLPPTKEHIIPNLILNQAGISEETIPGKLLPKAPGCDYTRPYNKGIIDKL